MDMTASHGNRYFSIVASRLSHGQNSISKLYLFMNILNIQKIIIIRLQYYLQINTNLVKSYYFQKILINYTIYSC